MFNVIKFVNGMTTDICLRYENIKHIAPNHGHNDSEVPVTPFDFDGFRFALVEECGFLDAFWHL